MPIDEIETAYYLRLSADDRPGVLAEITRILGDLEISIEAFVQKEPREGMDKAEIILLTNRVQEGAMMKAINQIESLKSVADEVTRIRVESLG